MPSVKGMVGDAPSAACVKVLAPFAFVSQRKRSHSAATLSASMPIVSRTMGRGLTTVVPPGTAVGVPSQSTSTFGMRRTRVVVAASASTAVPPPCGVYVARQT